MLEDLDASGDIYAESEPSHGFRDDFRELIRVIKLKPAFRRPRNVTEAHELFLEITSVTLCLKNYKTRALPDKSTLFPRIPRFSFVSFCSKQEV